MLTKKRMGYVERLLQGTNALVRVEGQWSLPPHSRMNHAKISLKERVNYFQLFDDVTL